MDRYLIESPHDAEDCDAIIREIHAAGYLHYFEWGCHDGAHCGWAIIETENKEHAKQIVPWNIRNKARVVKLEKFESTKPHTKKKFEKKSDAFEGVAFFDFITTAIAASAHPRNDSLSRLRLPLTCRQFFQHFRR